MLLLSPLVRTRTPLHNPPHLHLDLPDHGESAKPDNVDYSVDFFAASITAVLEAESIETVVLIAHSMAGVIATTLLRSLGEERVKGIVFAHAFWLAPSHYLSASQRAAWHEGLKDNEAMWAMFAPGFSTSKAPFTTVARIKKVMTEDTQLHVRLSAGTTDSLPQHWRWEEVFTQTPMLHLTSVAAPEWDKQAERHLRRLRVEKWEGWSIFLFVDEGARFNSRVEAFLGENGLV